MGLLKRRKADPMPTTAAWQADPRAALRQTQAGMAATGTFVGDNGNRRRLAPERRTQMLAALDSAVATLDAPDLPIWPSGIARLAAGIVEVTTGEGVRVALADLQEIGIKPPRAGRLSLTLKYRGGLSTFKRSFWVEAANEAALRDFVAAVEAAR
jgi:hypothetical protein